MVRIPSGVTDQYIYFVAVDVTDLKTRETGLSSFTVRRSRNGGASAAYTTPTVNETDVTNMPGVYELLLDEDMTLDAGDQSQEVCLHITHASMAPVTRVFELYRPSVTAGETIGVSSGAVSTVASVTAIAAGGITAGSIAADAIGASELAADAITEIQSGLATAANLATVAGYLDTEIAAILADTNELQTDWADGGRLDLILDARASQASVDTIDGIVDAILVDTGTDIPALIATVDTVVDAIKVTTDKLDDTLEDDAGTFRFTTNALEQAPTGGSAPSAADIADAVWEEAQADHVGAGSFGLIASEIADILVDTGATLDGKINTISTNTTNIETDTQDIQSRLPAALVSGRMDASVGAMAANVMTAAAAAADLTTELQSGLATASALATLDGKVDVIDANVDAILVDTGTTLDAAIATIDGIVDAIKLKTDALPSDPADASVVAGLIAGVDAKVDIVDGVVDAIKIKTDALPTDPADASVIAGRFDTLDTNLATVDTVVDAIKAKTDNLPTDPADQSLIIAATDAIIAAVGDVPTNAELATALAAADDAVLAAIAALNNLSAAQVNAEVVDALSTDTYAEPTGVPAATASLANKLGYIHMALRNKITVTSSSKSFYDDAGNVEWSKALSDDGTTYTEAEAA